MSIFRKLINLLLALGVVAFAMTANAQTSPSKLFSFGFNPGTNTSPPWAMGATLSTTPTTLIIRVWNESPDANSNINSIMIIPPSGVSLSGFSASTLSSPTLSKVKFDTTSVPGTIRITSIPTITPLIKPSGDHYIDIKVSLATATANCGTVINWDNSEVRAFTGNNLDAGSEFAWKTGDVMTITGPTCTLSFTGQPMNTLAGGSMGAVKVTASPASSFTGASVTLVPAVSNDNGTTWVACTANCPTITPSSKAIDGSGLADFSGALISGPAGTYKLLAKSGTISTMSTSFVVGPSDGTLDCSVGGGGGTSVFTATSDTTLTDLTGSRGGNKDGGKCVVVQYDVTVTDTESHVQWDTNLQPFAALDYTIDYKPRPVDSSTGLGKKLQVKWGSMTQYVNAQMCTGSTLPVSYGTLTAAIAPSTTDAIQDISVMLNTSAPLAPTTYPFAITIDQERMTVLGAGTSGTWSVKRGQGGTVAAGHATTYSDGTTKKVMSNPLPLYVGDPTSGPVSGLAAGTQMAMCMVTEQFYTDNTCDPSLSACAGLKVRLFDVGDGWNTWP